MNTHTNRRLFQGFIRIHILFHAQIEPVYGNWMLEELSKHGYKLSPGTLYPILHSLEKEGLLNHYEENVGGKIRKYYVTTELGKLELTNAKKYLSVLLNEIA